MASNDNLTAQGIAAYQSGDVREARRLLAQAVKDDKNDEQGWYYLGLTQSDPEKREQCMKMALRINPNNAEAQAELDKLVTPDNVMDMPASKPKANPALEQQVSMDYGLLKAIPGAPSSLSLGDVVKTVQTGVQGGISAFTMQGDGKSGAWTWWNFFLTVGVFSFIIGLITGIARLIIMLDSKFVTFDIIPVLSAPILTMIIGTVGVTAGAFVSHWYATKQAGGQATLLQHSSAVGRLWIVPSLALAIIQFVVFLIEVLSDDGIGGIIQLEWIFRWGFPSDLEGGTIALTIVAIAITGYTAFLMAKKLGNVHGAGKQMWIPALIMLFVTAFVFT